MKKIIIPVSALFLTGFSFAQTTPSNSENYIYTKTYLSDPSLSNPKTSETVQYFDGLGRPEQVINVKASPTGKDIVQHFEYDGFGRQVKDYLPIPQSGTQNGAIYTDPKSGAPAIYGTEKIFSESILENSPLDKILQQVQAGTDWATKPVKFNYEANSVEDQVRIYQTSTIWDAANKMFVTSLQTSQFYPAVQLYKNTVIDEDGNKTIEFKNGEGQTILIRKVVSASENADTYFVYNEYDQLVYKIPPIASKSGLADQTTLDNLCYQYRHDGKYKLVEKKLPGKGWEYMVYDRADRLVMIQDANLKVQGKWMFTKYDQFGRVVYTGITNNIATRQVLQNNVTAATYSNEIRSANTFTINGMPIYYTNRSLPGSIAQVLSINYYDTYAVYSFNPSFPSTILGKTTLTDNPVSSGKSTNSLPVMSFVKNIEDDNWTKNYSYYDTKGRAIGSYSINHLGGYTKTESDLDFVGLPKQTKTYHKRVNTDTERIITETFEYDNQNRVKKHYHQIDSQPQELLAENTYNELSQLSNKTVGNNLQNIDYSYNIRGWLTKINNPANLAGKLFGYEIKYNNPVNTSSATGKYSGNIAEVDWMASNDGVLKRYSYQYDGLNRLKSGIYSEPNTSIPQNNYYNEILSYDLNGNITSLQRNRNTEYIGAQLMDNLSYSYTGNRLDTVTDSSGNYMGYPDTSGNLIHYDANGNMTDHVDKAILQIDYNYLNLPKYVKFNQYITGRNSAIYVNSTYNYRADGSKIAKVYTFKDPRISNTLATTSTDYLDGFQYEAKSGGTESTIATLQFIPTSEGYFDFGQNKYIYQYKDQVGNIRLAFFKDGSGNPAIDRATDFYPFGLEFGGNGLNINNSVSPSYTYTFQGQEKQQETGWNSFRWRNYDPTIGRFFNIDPLAEKFPHNSTYAFQENMIGMGIELEGLELLPENKGYFAIRGNEMIVKQAPATQRDSFGRPTFTAADIGLTTNGYNPTAPRISTGETGLRLKSYNYGGATAEGATMETIDTPSGFAEQEVETERPNRLKEAVGTLSDVVDGAKELWNNISMAMDVPEAFKSMDNHVQAAKDIKSVDFNATQMDLAIDYVNSSKIKMNQQTKNDVINYVYDGHLPKKGLMQNSLIIQNGNAILKANHAPIRPTADQVKRLFDKRNKEIKNNQLRNIPQ
ncbi:hypothetical protein ATE47_02165 [Chryseobacterium sp. IHB B 17019]|uniref:DUF6443 domain-containing protein n=1 Tax=Chryseobacterium sp. IHB B 17019 TaxID=1721091 RepID=UPI0007203712|nr:DUF6443 domain-containing protein [Chryseobacterium sp. IHB B 17019]ALR29411.1 hypothetical protein ATE47_02165 [Chryseobacterium sp. IHB B 17019]